MAEPKILSALKVKASLESPAFTGIPTVPTAANGTNNTQIASTAFVASTLGNYSSTDTKNTAGSTNLTSTKLYVIGATSQEANPQTYSNSSVYISANNVLMGRLGMILPNFAEVIFKNQDELFAKTVMGHCRLLLSAFSQVQK